MQAPLTSCTRCFALSEATQSAYPEKWAPVFHAINAKRLRGGYAHCKSSCRAPAAGLPKEPSFDGGTDGRAIATESECRVRRRLPVVLYRQAAARERHRADERRRR